MFSGKTKHQPVVTPVIILGYMRSGSSLTGDILQQNSQVFYVFEPLRDLQKDYFNTMDEIFPHIQIRYVHFSLLQTGPEVIKSFVLKSAEHIFFFC